MDFKFFYHAFFTICSAIELSSRILRQHRNAPKRNERWNM